MNNICVITTFPSTMWEIYAKQMLQSFVQFWPNDIPLLVQLDDDLVVDHVKSIVRKEDAIAVGWDVPHKAFVERNKEKDTNDYRKQPVRFCHKVYAIKRALEAIRQAKENKEHTARYLIWMDADVVTTAPVDLTFCLPKEGDAVSYLGRKDWLHSECGWVAFDLEKGGDAIIDAWVEYYNSDKVLMLEQQHDSWVFDRIKGDKATNLTFDKPGMDIWPHSPMGKWSTHYKGPAAKNTLAGSAQPKQRMSNIVIQTKNAIPNEEICNNIRINQLFIKNWITKCTPNDEEIVIVSAGPMLIAEDVRNEVAAGRKIVAVKHALEPLEKAGIKPWACILLDPREHVSKFVETPDADVLWIVATQVNPEATKRLLEAGCEVWGYHAAVGAGEEKLTEKQANSTIAGGSATSTRGMYMLNHLGFKKFRLYGYDLCYPEKPSNSDDKDKDGQPKYLEVSVGFNHPRYGMKRSFWTEPQLLAQFEELNEIIRMGRFNIKAFGQGIIPFVVKAKETGELREKELKAKLGGTKLVSYDRLLKCSRKKKTKFSMRLPKLSLMTRLKRLSSSR